MLRDPDETLHFTAVPAAAFQNVPSGAPGFGAIISRRPAENPAPRVLVVDDEGLLRWSLTEMLEQAGYQVVEARDGREARRALGDRTHPVQAVLLDVRLPDVSGVDLLVEARRQGLSCPVVVMTAYGSAETTEAALSAGAHAVMTKPFDLDDLLRVLRRICPAGPPR